jgi:omega-6 fatty acid desaturase (delta-12 desaturase)
MPGHQSSPAAVFSIRVKRFLGPSMYAAASIAVHLLLGWPLYLLFGVTGGPDQGFPASHFINTLPFYTGIFKLFPGKWSGLMRVSNAGLAVALLMLAVRILNTSAARVLCVYGLPRLIVNGWLVSYTWLKHTDPDIPHFSAAEWN